MSTNRPARRRPLDTVRACLPRAPSGRGQRQRPSRYDVVWTGRGLQARAGVEHKPIRAGVVSRGALCGRRGGAFRTAGDHRTHGPKAHLSSGPCTAEAVPRTEPGTGSDRADDAGLAFEQRPEKARVQTAHDEQLVYVVEIAALEALNDTAKLLGCDLFKRVREAVAVSLVVVAAEERAAGRILDEFVIG